ncbi:hypothetical protein [Cysteiniphilum sp. 6C5]|uniref:hypothetical protein n=1 Tax=unclassified Cysteiniphilum TaxID=2610889 RepID=UPI003F835A5A
MNQFGIKQKFMTQMKQTSVAFVAVIAVITGSVVLSGCANIEATQQAAKANFNTAQDIMAQATAKQDNALISYNKQIYIADKGFEVKAPSAQLPKVFSESFTFRSNQKKDLFEILSEIGQSSSVSVRVTQDAQSYMDQLLNGDDKNKASNAQVVPITSLQPQRKQTRDLKMSLNFQGTLAELLTYVTTHYDLSWRYNHNRGVVDVYHLETRTFALDMLPGTSQTKVKIENASKGENATQNMSNDFDSGVNDPWKSVLNIIQDIIGKAGSVQSAPASGYVTVTSTPDLINKVQNFINTLNTTARKSIALRVDIYDVETSGSSNYGIDWNAMYKVTKGALSWSTNGIPNPLSDPYSGSVQTATVTGGISSGPFAGSQLIVSALQQMGHTTYVTGTTVYTVNGRPAPIQVSRSTDYVKETSVTSLGTSSIASDNVQTSMTPGTISTGYTVDVTPRIIKGNKVLLSLSVNIASLLKMRQVTSGPKDAQSTIELPDLRNKSFMQTVPLTSGQTAVLAGFQNDTNNDGTNSVGPQKYWYLGGKQATNKEHTVTVVIVTPYIIDNNESEA